MYIPPHFNENQQPVLHDFIRSHPLATLVTHGDSGLQASPVPLLLHAPDGGAAVLRGHLARPNPHLREMEAAEGLAIFTGKSYYVSPSWYPSKAEDGKVVPTWNYIAVHARGPLRLYDDSAWLKAFLQEFTDTHERFRSPPWRVSDAPADFIERLIGAIVGFEMRIEKLEGKFKQSQNRPRADREGVARGRSLDPDRS